ncbi:hypothetical protein IW262DRAFT_1281183, partial [Armillaria fumosa]
LRSKIWSTNILFNPPNLWITINPNDTHDPIAQVIAGKKIDLDDFLAHSSPSASVQAKNIAQDPFSSTKFFHLMIQTVLEGLFGITINKRRRRHVFF